MSRSPLLCRLIVLLLALAWANASGAAPEAELWPRWQPHDPHSAERVDHSPWDRFLQTYLVVDHPSGIHRVRYAAVSPADRTALRAYLGHLQAVAATGLNRSEQKAYWINLYNAITVLEILDHYPVSSIRKIKSGFFSAGPWDKELVVVQDTPLSLNDIEHRILRPIFADNRIHYAVNCASIGCPNLQPQAYTAGNAEQLLDRAAREYINHPRGARFENGRLHASSIYDWFQEDFGGRAEGVVRHLLRYAADPLAKQLVGYTGKIRYSYDWGLNEE